MSRKRGRRANQSDPTAERAEDQSTQSAAGLSFGARETPRRDAEDLFNRNDEARYETPRRYEHDAEE